MIKKFLLIISILFFLINPVHSTVDITQEEMDIFNSHGISVEDVDNYIYSMRSKGLDDETIRQQITNDLNILINDKNEKELDSLTKNNIDKAQKFYNILNKKIIISLVISAIILFFVSILILFVLIKKKIILQEEKINFEKIMYIMIHIIAFIIGFLGSIYGLLFLNMTDNTLVNVLGGILYVVVKTLIFYSLLIIVFSILFFIILKIFSLLKKIPRTNYHILGYLTFFYLLFDIFNYWFFNNWLEYAYYEILRWMIMLFAGWSAYRTYKEKPQNLWIIIFVAIAILYNPIFKFPFDKYEWKNINVITEVLFLISAIWLNIKRKKD